MCDYNKDTLHARAHGQYAEIHADAPEEPMMIHGRHRTILPAYGCEQFLLIAYPYI